MKNFLLFFILLFSLVINAQFTEDFENYTLGAMNTQNTTLWSDWYGDYTSAPIYVVNDIVRSGSQSGHVDVEDFTDAFLLLGNKTSGKWTLEFYMYIPTNQSGYFNIQGGTSETGGSDEGFLSSNIRFNRDNESPGSGIDQTSNSSFDFPHDTWFSVRIVFDVDNLDYQLIINDTLVNSTPTAFNSNATTLGAIDFHYSDTFGIYWIDDISFTEGSYLNIQDGPQSQSFLIYPNPTSNSFSITSSDIFNVENIIIYNTIGQKVLQANVSREIDISTLDNGVYFVEITDSFGKKTSQKLIKK